MAEAARIQENCLQRKEHSYGLGDGATDGTEGRWILTTIQRSEAGVGKMDRFRDWV